MGLGPKMAVTLPVALLSACAPLLLYDGPPRPDNEVATIIPSTVEVTSIDGRKVPTDHAFKALPGVHAVVGYLHNSSSYSTQPLAVCFYARAGHRYQVWGEDTVWPSSWHVRIIDSATGETVQSRPVDPYEPDCAGPSSRAVIPPQRSSWSPSWKLRTPALLEGPGGQPAAADGGVPTTPPDGAQ
jgi:hypothetical protein